MDIIKDMGRMPVEAEKKGRWYGKAGDLHVVYETEEGAGVIGQAFAGDRPVSTEDYEEILRRLTVAGIKDSYVYIFSACGFTQEIIDMAGDKIIPIAIEDL